MSPAAPFGRRLVATVVIVLSGVVVFAQDKTTSEPTLQERLEDLEEKVAALEAVVSFLEEPSVLTPGSITYVDCSTHEYQEVMPAGTRIFAVLVMCDRIEPYLEGHRATVRVANPHSLALANLSGSFRHGKESIDVLSRQLPLPTLTALRPGDSVSLDVIVNPSTASDMRHIAIDLSFGGLLLTNI